MSVKILVVVLLVVALGVACGGDGGDEAQPGPTTVSTPEQDAGAFMKEVTERALLGQYGRNWETLHPDHQAVVSRDKYDSCERQSDDGTGATKIDIAVVETYEEPVVGRCGSVSTGHSFSGCRCLSAEASAGLG